MTVKDLIDRENATIVGTMTRTFWKEAYRFGIDELDNEHMELCTLMAQFQKSVDDREDKEVIGSLFRKLRGKLVAHFNHEEKILRRIDYPEEDVREHIDGHLDVLYTFDREFSKWEKDPDDTRDPGGLSHVCVWANNELMTADMPVKDHMAGKHSEKASRK